MRVFSYTFKGGLLNFENIGNIDKQTASMCLHKIRSSECASFVTAIVRGTNPRPLPQFNIIFYSENPAFMGIWVLGLGDRVRMEGVFY